MLALLLTTDAFAAYQNPTKESVENLPDGATRILFRFAGDDGEPVVILPLRLEAGMTTADVRRWVGRMLRHLDDQHTIKKAVDGLTGPVAPLPPLTPTRETPTALQVCQGKYERFLRMKDSGLGGTIGGKFTALQADIEANCGALLD